MSKLFQRSSSKVRPPAVAGQFYPDDADELRRMIKRFLNEARVADTPDCVADPGCAVGFAEARATSSRRRPAPKAIIAPHAGYMFSGPVAASAYVRFAAAREVIKRVVLIGPSHFVPFQGLAASSAEAFATPLGSVPLDTDSVRQICAMPQVTILDEAHAREHSLEVHLPFLQVMLSDFKIVPLVVGKATDAEVAGVIDALWDGPETRFVISSDLSHYHDYATARELDAATARAIESLKTQDIGEQDACGRVPIRGLLHAAQRHGYHARTVDLRNSGDTAGPRDKVVGYGAFVFEDA